MKNIRGNVDRRAFLAGAATAGASAAAAATGSPSPANAAVPVTAKAPPPPAQLAAAETQSTSVVDRWHVKNAGSDYMVDCLKHLGYDYVTCMPGSTFRGLQESITNYGGNTKPELLSAVHEEISAAMAHGYAKMARKPMAIIVHNTVGLQHASMAVYNAYADRVPMMILVGNLADTNTRRPGVEWFHTATDIAAMVRGYVKYDEQPTSLHAFGEAMSKAHSLSLTPPHEPVLIVADGDLQEDAMGEAPAAMPAYRAVRAPIADPAALAEVAKLLVAAQNPVIVADRVANTAEGMNALVRLAETLEVPVIDLLNRMNFPTNHRLYAIADSRRLIATADLILGLELTDLFGVVADVQDLAVRKNVMKIKPGTKVVSINSMYVAGSGNYQDLQRFYQADYPIAGDTEASLPYLIDAVQRAMTSERHSQNPARAAHFREAFERGRAAGLEQVSAAWDASPIAVGRMVMEVYRQIKHDDFSLVSSSIFQSNYQQRLWDLDQHHHYNGDSGAYGVGYGMPAAVGAALAVRDQGRYAVNFQGDGDLLVAPGSLWTAAHHKIPLFTIMHNNRAWHQETMHLQRMANRRDRSSERAKIGTMIDSPHINFAKVAQGMGVYAEGPITHPSQLAPAISRSLKIVRSGRPALIDVVTQPR